MLKEEIKKIKEIATIQIGLVLSRQTNRSQNNNLNNIQKYKVLSLKSMKNSVFDTNCLSELSTTFNVNSRYLTKINDIIIRLSLPFCAYMIKHKHEENIVVPSQFLILKNINNAILPEFLQLYLNLPSVAKKIEANRSGTWLLNTIKQFSILNLEIQIPSIEKQKNIINLKELFDSEFNLQNRLLEKKGTFNNIILENLIKNKDINLSGDIK